MPKNTEDNTPTQPWAKRSEESPAAEDFAPVATEESSVVEEGDEKVTVTIPKNFILRIDHHDVLELKAGITQMKRKHAEHWYAKANGVQVYVPEE